MYPVITCQTLEYSPTTASGSDLDRRDRELGPLKRKVSRYQNGLYPTHNLSLGGVTIVDQRLSHER